MLARCPVWQTFVINRGELGVTQEQTPPQSDRPLPVQPSVLAHSYYGRLGLHPSASGREIRQAYRDLSKLYHPDTTTLPTAIATLKFQELNEAYATLSSPERRSAYDRTIGYSSVAVVQGLPSLHQNHARPPAYSSSAYLDPTDRPLSAGELFALFILGLTFVGCLVLAIAIGITRGEAAFQTATVTPFMPTATPAIPMTATPWAPSQLRSSVPTTARSSGLSPIDLQPDAEDVP